MEELDELERQIKIGWERGRDFGLFSGLFIGIVGTLLIGFFVKIMW